MLSALLNKVISIEKGVTGTSSSLTPITNYEEYITTKANVYVRSGDVRYDESEGLVYVTEFTIRYNSNTKVINNKYRIKYNEQYYKIIEVIEIEPKQTIKIIAQHFYYDE